MKRASFLRGLGVFSSVLILAGCAGQVTLNTLRVENSLTQEWSQMFNEVDCPADMTGSVGKVFECALFDTARTDPGKLYPIYLEVRIDAQNFSWRLTGSEKWNEGIL